MSESNLNIIIPEVTAMEVAEIDSGSEGALLASPPPRENDATELANPSAEVGSCSAPNPTGASASESIKPENRKKLSGAARKRFKRLRAANVSADEALVLCRQPWKEIPQLLPEAKALKRIRSEEESPKGHLTKAPKTTLEGRVKPTFSAVAGSIRVGIRGETPLAEEKMDLVRRSLVLLISKEGKGEGPRFVSFSHKPGWILVVCENTASKDWLKKVVPKLKPWPEAKLAVLEESELPKPTVVTTFIPSVDAKSLDEAITLLGTQNKGLNTELWKVLHSRKEEGGVVATFAVDDPSVESLKGTQGKAVIGFRSVVFRIKGDQAKEALENAGASTSVATQALGPATPTNSGQQGVPKPQSLGARPPLNFAARGRGVARGRGTARGRAQGSLQTDGGRYRPPKGGRKSKLLARGK